MHVLIVPSWYKNKEKKVFGTFFEEQARALMSAGHKVGVFAPGYIAFSQNFQTWKESYNDNGLSTYSIRIKNKLPGLRKLALATFLKKCETFFKAYIKENGIPEVIHAHSVFYGGYFAEYISNKYKIPFVITEHNTAFVTGEISSKDDLQMAQNVFRSANTCFAVSTPFSRKLNALFFDNHKAFEVLPNIVDALFFATKPESYNPETIKLFTVCYLVPRKNIGLLLKATAILIEKGFKIKVKIGGEGSERINLESRTDALGIANHVSFLGEITRIQVAQALSKTDMYVQTSNYETFGVALAEALAVGIPVISTDCGGPRDIINKKNGIILEGFSPEELAEKILSIWNNREHYNSKNIKTDCETRFSKDALVKLLNETYKSLDKA